MVRHYAARGLGALCVSDGAGRDVTAGAIELLPSIGPSQARVHVGHEQPDEARP